MKTVIEMAREAGMLVNTSRDSMKHLERFAELVRAQENEACADICGRFAMHASMNELEGYDAYRDCEEAIRARGQK